MAKNRVTIKDLARRLELSPATVSLALSGQGEQYRISADTRARIKTAARDMGYRPNHLARSMRRGRTDTIGVVFPDISESYMNNVLEGIEAVAMERKSSLMIASSSFDHGVEARNIEALLDRRVDGLILVPYAPFRNEDYDDAAIRMASESGTPIVALDRYFPGIIVHAVVGADRKAARAATERLISRGCRRLAYLGFDLIIDTLAERRRGFHDAAAAAGLDGDTTEFLVAERNAESRDIRNWYFGLVEGGNVPDGILVSTNGLALKLRALAAEAAARNPGSKPLIARFGEDSPYFPTGMLEVVQCHKDLGRRAMEKLFRLIGGATIPDRERIDVIDMEIRDETQ